MLVSPYLLKGIAALKAFFLLNNGGVPAYPRHVNRRLIGPAGAVTLGIAAVEYWRYGLSGLYGVLH